MGANYRMNGNIIFKLADIVEQTDGVNKRNLDNVVNSLTEDMRMKQYMLTI